MHKTIISDTSCLILLHKIGELDLLNKLFGTIITTPEVASEFLYALPSWIEIKEASDKIFQALVEQSIDKGEASAIALARELQDCLLIIDDLKGRNYALKLGFQITGTLGVIVTAKLSGTIDSIKPLLLKIRATNFRISERIEMLILKGAGE
jgi:predicted nucleic acid-binding protein